MWHATQITLGALLIFLLHSALAVRNYDFRITKFQCSHTSPQVFKRLNCNLNCTKNSGQTARCVVNMYTQMQRADAKIMVHLTMFVSRLNEKKTLKLFETDVDACDYFDRFVHANIVSIIVRTVQKHTTELPHCPYKTNFTYSITDFAFDPNDFPTYLPEGAYSLNLLLSEAGKSIGQIDGALDVFYRRTLFKKPKN